MFPDHFLESQSANPRKFPVVTEEEEEMIKTVQEIKKKKTKTYKQTKTSRQDEEESEFG